MNQRLRLQRHSVLLSSDFLLIYYSRILAAQHRQSVDQIWVGRIVGRTPSRYLNVLRNAFTLDLCRLL